MTLVAIFSPFFFQGKSFLPQDLYLMLYKPFAAQFPAFLPYNHFDDDILKFCYLYQWGARAHLYRPYWIPEIFGGIPLYANTYASHFSTLNWLLPLGPLAVTYPLKLLCSLWIAGTAMFSFTRLGLRLSFWSALLSGLAYMFSGIFITMLLRWWVPGAFAWVPLLLLGTNGLCARFGRRAFLLCVFSLAFAFLDGFFQTSASIVLAWGMYFLFLGWRSLGWTGFFRSGLKAFSVGLVAFLLSAIMWIPQLEYFYFDIEKGSSRSSGLYFYKNFFERLCSIPALVAAFFPQVLGNPRTLDLGKFFHSHIQDFAPFVGVLPLLFALVAWPQRKKKPVAAALWFLVLLGIGIPIFTPLDRYLYFRFLAVYVVGICALAGLGFESTLERKTFPPMLLKIFWGLWFLIAGGALAIRGLLLVRPGWLEQKAASFIAERLELSTIGARNPEWMIERARMFVRYWALGSAEFVIPLLLTFAALALLALWQKQKVARGAFIGSVFLLTGLQLGMAVHSWFGFHSSERYPLFPDNEIAQFLRQADPEHKFRASVDDLHGLKEKELQIIPANTNFFYGYYTLEGFDGVRPGTASDVNSVGPRRLGELNVKYILTNPEPPMVDKNLRLRHKGSIAIYENLLARSRGRIFFSYESKSPREIRSIVGRDGVDPKTVYLPETLPGFTSENRLPAPAKLVSDSRERVVYQMNSPRPAIFLATETYFPGWKAYWNGQEKRILRANDHMRAVVIPAGEGSLEFRFEPASYRWGWRISAITAILLLGLSLFPIRGQKKVFPA
jgi:hypothetical protein